MEPSCPVAPPGILFRKAGLDGWWVLPATCDPTIRVVPLRRTRSWWATNGAEVELSG